MHVVHRTGHPVQLRKGAPMRKASVCALALCLSVAFVIGRSVALDSGPDTIDLNAQIRHKGVSVVPDEDKKQVKGFTHRSHQNEYMKGNQEFSVFKYDDDFTCSGCHHGTKKGEQPGSCLQCKMVDKMVEKVGGKFQDIFHKSCRECHKAMDKAGKKTGPTKCNDCHNRQ